MAQHLTIIKESQKTKPENPLPPWSSGARRAGTHIKLSKQASKQASHRGSPLARVSAKLCWMLLRCMGGLVCDCGLRFHESANERAAAAQLKRVPGRFSQSHLGPVYRILRENLRHVSLPHASYEEHASAVMQKPRGRHSEAD